MSSCVQICNRLQQLAERSAKQIQNSYFDNDLLYLADVKC